MLSARARRQLLQVTENTYKQLVLKVLATFEISWGSIAFHHTDFIQFQAFSLMHRMSLTHFSIWLGLYDIEFTRTPAYDALVTSRLAGE